MADFYLKQGDTGASLVVTPLDANGATVNLSGATAVFSMRRQGTDTLTINRRTATVGASTLTVAWQAGDTATSGIFSGEFEVTYSNGQIQTFPNSADLAILISDDIG